MVCCICGRPRVDACVPVSRGVRACHSVARGVQKRECVSRVCVCAYVENKAGLTGQTFPGRRIPGHWPYPAPEELAETEPASPDWQDVPFFYPPNRARAGHARPAWPHQL